jgi:chromosome segregation ATPase
MIESIMYFGIGFLFAALGVLVVAPVVHRRAVRLTTRQLESTNSTAEILAHKDLQRAEFAVSTRRLEMKLEQLETRSASQFAELGKKAHAINRLKNEVGALGDQLRATEEELALKSKAMHDVEQALPDKELKLADLSGELDKRSMLVDTQQLEIIALKTQVEAKATALDEAERALSGQETKLAELMDELDERSTLVDTQKLEIITLKTEVEAKASALDGAERTLSDQGSKLTKLMDELDQWSTLADAQKLEITTLKSQVEALSQQLEGANKELKMTELCRHAERIELETATQKMMEERAKFDNFHHRVAELVKQVVAQTTQDRILGRQVQTDLENRIIEQSKLLNELESEFKHVHAKLDTARKTEADLRVTILEIENRDDIQKLEAEKARMQAALDRANGERMRLAHELASIKRQSKEAWAA